MNAAFNKLVYGFGLFAAGSAGWLLGGSSSSKVTLTFLNVGQGDCAALTQSGHAILVDVGPPSGARGLVTDLYRMGIRSVDLILLSHPDSDHVGGLEAVLRAYPEAKVAISRGFERDDGMQKHLAEAHTRTHQVVWLSTDSTLRFGSLSLFAKCPTPGFKNHDNEGSMFVHIGGTGGATLSGDAPVQVEEIEEPLADWSASVIKAGHHGSRSSTSDSWLKETHPRYVVISVGKNNRYGHPTAEALDRIRKSGAEALRTDQLGDIQFVWTGTRFERG